LLQKAETDGDLHIELQDMTGDKPGIVVVEVPAKPPWCEICNTVFSWTPTRFPFHARSAKKLTRDQTPVIPVTAKRSSMSVILLKTKNQTAEAIFRTNKKRKQSQKEQLLRRPDCVIRCATL
jgi:hypothetical protein